MQRRWVTPSCTITILCCCLLLVFSCWRTDSLYYPIFKHLIPQFWAEISELSYLFTVSTPFNPNLFIFSISSTSWARGALSSALSAENAFDAESYVCRICGFWVAFNMLRRSRWKLSYTYRFEPFKAIGIALESHLILSNRFTNTLTILSFYCMQWKPFGYRYRLLPVSFVESEAQGYLQNVHSNELLTGRWWNLILYLEFFKRNNKVDILILKNT